MHHFKKLHEGEPACLAKECSLHEVLGVLAGRGGETGSWFSVPRSKVRTKAKPQGRVDQPDHRTGMAARTERTAACGGLRRLTAGAPLTTSQA